jgi:hypothetical protein
MSDGALLELVARGKKDAFFIQDPSKTFFTTPYVKRSPSTREIWYEETKSPALFGHFVDIEIPRVGDLLMSVEVRIQMPTWLPPDIAALNRTVYVDGSGNPTPDIRIESNQGNGLLNYGWTNGIANFLIKRWVLLMDSIQIQEGYGDYNDWQPGSDTTHLRAPLYNAATGTHDGVDSNIQRNATLPELIFRVPLVGCQGSKDVGLPLIGLRAQKLVLRLFLADKVALVESGLYQMPVVPTGSYSVYEVCPVPWDGCTIYVDGVPAGETLQHYQVGQPNIRGRFELLHVDEEMREVLRKKEHAIMFKQQYRQEFVLDNADWPRLIGTTTSKNISIELQGLFQRLFLGFTSIVRKKQNKYRDLKPPVNFINGVYTDQGITAESFDYISELSVQINNQDRIYPWQTNVFQELTQNLQLSRDVARKLYFIIFGVSPGDDPGGAINLARTQKAILMLTLNYILPDVQLNQKQTLGSLMGDAWNVLDFKDGVAIVRYTD